MQTGYWPLYRYNPSLTQDGHNPFRLDSKTPSLPLEKYIYTETRYRMLTQSDAARAEQLLKLAQADVLARWEQYERMAGEPHSTRT